MAISDSARNFWDRISPRERMLVVIAAIAVPVTLALWLAFAISDGLDAREAHNDDIRAALKIVDDLHARGAVPPPIDDVVLPADPLPLESYLDKAATKAGFQLKGTTPRPDQPRGDTVTTSVSLALDRITLPQLKDFLQEVEAQKIVAVTRLEIHKDYNDDKLGASLEVSTYSKPLVKKADGSGSGGSATGSADTKASP